MKLYMVFMVALMAGPCRPKQPQPWEQMRAAIVERDATAVARLIAEGVSPNERLYIRHGTYRDIQSLPWEPPLHLAIAIGHKPTIECLLAAGADPNGKNEYGETVLMSMAAVQPHEPPPLNPDEWVRLLLKAGMQIDARDANGRTALHFAAENCHAEFVELLLRHGADPNSQDADGNTPLNLCVQELGTLDPTETAGLLLAQGADPDIPNKQGESPRARLIEIGVLPAK